MLNVDHFCDAENLLVAHKISRSYLIYRQWKMNYVVFIILMLIVQRSKLLGKVKKENISSKTFILLLLINLP